MKFLLSLCIVVIALNSACNAEAEAEPKQEPQAQQNSLSKEVSLLEWEAPYEIQKSLPYYLSGYDSEGRPIWMAEVGKWDLRKLVEAGGDVEKALDKYADQFILRLNNSASMGNDNKTKPGFVIVADADKYDLNQLTSIPTVTFLLRKTVVTEKTWRNTMEYGFAINMNNIAEAMYRVMKPALGPITDRIEVYGTNAKRWLPALAKRLPKNQIPTWYGGAKTPKDIVTVYG